MFREENADKYTAARRHKYIAERGRFIWKKIAHVVRYMFQ